MLRVLGWVLLAGYFVLGVGYIALRWYIWPFLDDWRPRIETSLTEAAGRPVRMDAISTGFDGLAPTLQISGLRIDGDDGKPLLEVPRVLAVLSVRTLWSGELRFAELRLTSPRLVAERDADGAVRVAGIPVRPDGSGAGDGADRLMLQRRIVVERGTLDWTDAQQDRRQRFEGIDVALGNVGRRHRLAVSVRDGGPLFDGAQAVAEFFRPVRSRPSEWRRWQGDGYLGAERLDAGALADWLGAASALPLERGTAALRAWWHFDSGQVRDGQLKLAGRDLRTRVPLPALGFAAVELDLQASPAEGPGWDLRLARLVLDDGQGLRASGTGVQQLLLDAQGGLRGGRLALEELDAARLLAFALRLPLDAHTREVLSRMTVAGRRKAPSFAFGLGNAAGFDGTVEFEGLGMRVAHAGPLPTMPDGRPLPRVPGFANLSGRARVGHDRGELDIDARSATLFFPGVYEEEALPMQLLQARTEWKVGTSPDVPKLLVRVPQLRFANADAAGNATGTWQTAPKGGPGIIELDARLDRADAARTARYLPQQLPAAVRGWVARAVTAGSSDDVVFRVRGDLHDFPFHEPGTGEFRIDAGVHEGTLTYAPEWPSIERFEGRLLFERDGLDIRMNTGRIFGVALGEARARIADYGTSLLVIDGSGSGPAADMLRFLNESPLATRINDFTRDTVVDGNARLALKLELPIRNLVDSRIAGSVTFSGNDLQLDNTLPRLSGVHGRLEFSDAGLALRQMSATFLGGPLKVEGETPEPGRFQLRAQGSIAAEEMRRVADNPLTEKLSGRTDYSAEIDVRRRAATVRIESDLVGLASALPPPFDKPADARWPLRVLSEPRLHEDPLSRPTGDRISVALRDSVRLVFDRDRRGDNDKLLIRRGAFAIGSEPVMPDNGFAVSLNQPEVDLDAWGALLGGVPLQDSPERIGSEFAPGFSLLPSVVSVVAPRVKVAGKDLHEVVFGATRLGGFWRANISAREINGFFNWRAAAPGQPHGALVARFAKLEIPPSRRGDVESLLDEAPDALPALDLVADEFVLNERKLGSLKLVASNEGSGAASAWNLKELTIEHPAGTLSATGAWASERRGSDQRSTRLDFTLASRDSGALLDTFGIRDALRGGAGQLSGRIQWQGSPLSIHFPTLSGELRTELGAGQFMKTEPGIAKLIGVVNLQALPRRLNLDFRDVLAEGFAFDRIDGDVQIVQGVARTSDLSMVGLQAKVRISGEADLARETQALEVEVRPELNAGLASLAWAAMANPALGIGTFFAQLVLRKPLENLFTYEYLVTGSWTDPHVVEKRRYALTPPHSPAVQ